MENDNGQPTNTSPEVQISFNSVQQMLSEKDMEILRLRSIVESQQEEIKGLIDAQREAGKKAKA